MFKSSSHRCYLFEVAFLWELTEETIDLPLDCLQGGIHQSMRRRREVVGGAALLAGGYTCPAIPRRVGRACERGGVFGEEFPVEEEREEEIVGAGTAGQKKGVVLQKRGKSFRQGPRSLNAGP